MHFVEKVMEIPSTPRYSIQARYGLPKSVDGKDKSMDPWHSQVVQNMAPLEVPLKVRYGKMKMKPKIKNFSEEHQEL